MKKPIAEFIGTFTLVLFGCGAAVLAGADIGLTGISFAFGLALIAMAYGIGPVSGCHINPAVTLGVTASGRMGAGEGLSYIVAQIAGGIAGAFILSVSGATMTKNSRMSTPGSKCKMMDFTSECCSTSVSTIVRLPIVDISPS